MSPNCPAPDRLQQFLCGLLPPAGMDQMAAHLDQCPDCQARAESMFSDLPALPELRQDPGGMNSPALQKIIRELTDTDPREVRGSAPEACSAPGKPPARLGDYEILNELGRGGMGVVYRARQIRLNRMVALKLIAGGQLASPAEVRRFRNEAEAAARLDHPRIVPVYETGEDDHRHFLSMKLIEGQPLSRAMAEVRLQKSPREIALLVAQIARALHYAHQHGVLHRDIKPGNILLDAAGEPHLTDFGLAKMLDADPGLTRSESVMGTPNYLAPEVASGSAKQATTSADVYGLGAILYEILAGHPPFAEGTLSATLQKILTAEPSSPRCSNPAVPRDLETICLKALAKEPARRYATALELAHDLECFSRHEPISARPASATGKLVRWCRRQPALAASLLALGFVFLLGFAGVLWKWNGEVEQRRFAEQEGRRAQQAVTRLEIERAESLLEAGDSSKALAYLARLLRQQPGNSVVAERLMSALSQRSFCLPVAALRHGKSLNSLTVQQEREFEGTFAFRRPGSVLTAIFSPDGRWVLTGAKDGTARLWDAMRGEPRGEPLRHEAEVLCAQFSADGRRMITASADGSASVWAVAGGQPAAPALRHGNVVWFAAFSPDGERVVTASQDKTARVWNSRNGEPAGRPLLHQAAVYFCCFSPDGKFILTADDGNQAHLWDSTTGLNLATVDHSYVKGQPMTFPQFRPAPAPGQVATLLGYHAILRDMRSSSPEVLHLSHESYVIGTTYSPDGRHLATLSLDATATIWDSSNGKATVAPLRHGHWVECADFSRDGQGIATAAGDNSARLWDVRTGRTLAEPLRHHGEVRWVKLNANGQRLVTITENDTAWLWDVRILQPLAVWRYLPSAARFARFSHDGQRIVLVGEMDEARVGSTHSARWETPAIRHGDNKSIRDARFSPDNRLWVTASEDGTAQVWETATGKPVGPLMRHRELIGQAFFSPDGHRVVTASQDDTVRVWETGTGKLLLELLHSGDVTDARFNPNGSMLVTASRDGSARVWDAATGEPVSPPLPHDGAVYWTVFDPSGQRVASGSDDKTARIWSVPAGRMLTPPLVHPDSLHPVHSGGFSPDGSRLATVAGSTVHIWDAGTGRAITAPLLHKGVVCTAEFSPDGRSLLTASEDGTARLWDPETGHPVSEPMRHGSRVTSAEFSPDGTQVLTCSSDRGVRIREVMRAPMPVPDWLPDLAEAVAGQHTDEREVSEVLPVEALYALRQRLITNSDSDYYGRWGRWFVADSATRTISPSSLITVPEYVKRRIEENTRESLREATRLSSTNALAFVRLAQNLAATKTPLEPGTREDADWLSRYAAELAPGDEEVQKIRREVIEKLGQDVSGKVSAP